MMYPRYPRWGATSGQRSEATKQALADVVRRQMDLHGLRAIDVNQSSDVTVAFVRSVLREEQTIPIISLIMFVELSTWLKADPCELLREILKRRDVLLGSMREK